MKKQRHWCSSPGSLGEIVSMVGVAADQVRTIATASEQQPATSEEINRAASEVNTISIDTAYSMDEANRAVAELVKQAQTLVELVDNMKKG